MDTTSQHTEAGRARAGLEWATRAGEGGGRYVRVRAGAPQWVRDLVRDCHGDLFPDDYRYEYVLDALEALDETDADEDSARECLSADTYHPDLLAWVASHSDRAGRVHEWVSDYGWPTDGLYAALQGAQAAERVEVLGLVAAWLVGHGDEEDEGTEEGGE